MDEREKQGEPHDVDTRRDELGEKSCVEDSDLRVQEVREKPALQPCSATHQLRPGHFEIRCRALLFRDTCLKNLTQIASNTRSPVLQHIKNRDFLGRSA